MSAIPSTGANSTPPLSKLAKDYFNQAQWSELMDEDRFALSSVAILLASIVGLGLAGVAIVVSILAFF